MRRRVIADGDYHEVSCAVDAQGNSPAWDYLEALRAERNRSKPPFKGRAGVYQRLLDYIQELAEEGTLSVRDSYRSLGSGIWELRAETARITFYDTDGVGSIVPKLGEKVPTWDGATRRELPEDFGEFIRLGHSFNKQSQRTLQADLQRAQQVRKEDTDHDRSR